MKAYPMLPRFGISGDTARLFRRKGGGGKGSSSKGGSSAKGSSKGGSSASSVAKSHGASSAFTSSRGAKTFYISDTPSGSSAYPYSDGGGKRITLGSTSSFSGREAGGATRGTVYGTSRLGSGYPYGGYGVYVDNRPFPYYFYPAPVSHNYYGGDEYLNATDRPGGNLTVAIVKPSDNTDNVTYRLVGDNSSVIAAFDAVVANCSVANSSSAFATFEPSSTTWPVPEQIVQYYRASSFALSLDTYNNTASLPANAPASNNSSPVEMTDTPLPSGLNTTFLQCLNYTIGASVPLVAAKQGLTTSQIIQIVFGSILGFVFLACCLVCCCYKPCCRGRRKNENAPVEKLGDDIPDIRIIGSDEKKPHFSNAEAPKDGFVAKGVWSNSRPISTDGHSLVAESFGPKDRWSYASSLRSSRPVICDNAGQYDLAKVDMQSRTERQQDTAEHKSSWLSKIHLPGRSRYRSVKHQSSSSMDLPLTEAQSSCDVLAKEHDNIVFPSPTHSRPSSRSPSPSPTTPSCPLIPGEYKGTLHES